MSAIKEWFGIYNMIFRHMKSEYGDKGLKDYITYIADNAFKDTSENFKVHGLKAVMEKYMNDYIKDDCDAQSSIKDNRLYINVNSCAAYKYMLNSENPYDRPEDYYCDSCIELNKKILENSGFKLIVQDCSKTGKCKWTIEKDGALYECINCKD